MLAPLAVAAVLTGPPTAAAAAAASPPAASLSPCRLAGLEHDALCATVRRPLDPAAPAGPQIDVHFAVLPALARQKKPDPVFMFAGGPGQSAIGLAGSISRVLARLGNRRDIVLVDQRGTGRSAPLECPPQPTALPLAEATIDRLVARLQACRAALQALPHGDLRHYTTTAAVADVEAVRLALGAERINLVGGSYGTRAALEYQRQFPQAVRRMVLDGVAPPDMVLPAAFSLDSQAALDRVFAACEAEPACSARQPALRSRWQQLLATLPRRATVAHPFSGRPESVELTRELLLMLVRAPLYTPALGAALPAAIAAATEGRFEPLAALGSSFAARREMQLAEGMHFAVICSEDAPRLAAATSAPESRGADFGDVYTRLYARACADWPRGAVPEAFYRVGPTSVATLVLSGGADPATPPRHGERVVAALGAQARHVVVDEAGHGLMSLPCLRDVLFRFIDAEDDAAALAVDTGCAARLPRPPAFVPPSPAGAAAKGAAR